MRLASGPGTRWVPCTRSVRCSPRCSALHLVPPRATAREHPNASRASSCRVLIVRVLFMWVHLQVLIMWVHPLAHTLVQAGRS